MIQNLVENRGWLQAFRQHLINQDRAKLANALDFVILCQSIIEKTNENKSAPSYTGRAKDLQDLHQNHLKEDCPQPVAFQNQVLREKLCHAVIMTQIPDLEQLLQRAIDDYKIWKGGLEPMYKNFIASKPLAPSPVTIVASILFTLW